MLLNCIFSILLWLFNISTILITGSPIHVSSGYPFSHKFLLFHCFLLFLSLSQLSPFFFLRFTAESGSHWFGSGEEHLCSQEGLGAREREKKARENWEGTCWRVFGSGIRMNRGESHYERPCCLGFVYMTHDNISRLLLFLFRLQVIREIDDRVWRLLNMSIIMRTVLY